MIAQVARDVVAASSANRLALITVKPVMRCLLDRRGTEEAQWVVNNLFGEKAMMKPANQSRFFRGLLGSACIAVLVVSCTADESPPPPMTGSGSGSGSDPYPDPNPGPPKAMDLDPTGNWDLTYMISPGCDQPASTAMDTFTVTRNPDGFAVSAAGATTMGTLLCTLDSCKLSAVFAWADSGLQYLQSANMVLDPDDSITGNGTVFVTDGMTSCNLTFTVTGSRS